MTTVLDKLEINRAAIRRNLGFLHGINMAESVMIELTRRGMNRQDAHERVRMASMQALAESRPLADVLGEDPEIIRYCSRNDLRDPSRAGCLYWHFSGTGKPGNRKTLAPRTVIFLPGSRGFPGHFSSTGNIQNGEEGSGVHDLPHEWRGHHPQRGREKENQAKTVFYRICFTERVKTIMTGL